MSSDTEAIALTPARLVTLACVRSYRRRRQALIERMGGRCVLCGSTEQLELDHPYGREWKAKDVNRWTRIKLYEQDFEFGNLRLLCKPCNLRHLPETDF